MLGETIFRCIRWDYEILQQWIKYGMNWKCKRQKKLMQRCIMAPRFYRGMLDSFHEARQNMIWINRIARSREGCAAQLDLFADMLQMWRKIWKTAYLQMKGWGNGSYLN